MATIYLSLDYHIITATKNRHPLIVDGWRSRFHEYLGGTVRGLEGIPLAIGGVADHVHLLIGLHARHCLSDFIRELKKTSSVWAARHGDPAFQWQDSYAAFTVGISQIEAVRTYVLGQEEHHAHRSSKDELKQWLQKAGIHYNPDFFE